MVKRFFNGTVKCGFCGKELTMDEIAEYIPFDKREDDLDEEQCPHCGYHNSFIEEPYEQEYFNKQYKFSTKTNQLKSRTNLHNNKHK